MNDHYKDYRCLAHHVFWHNVHQCTMLKRHHICIMVKAVEKEVKGLKKGAGRKCVMSKAPNQLGNNWFVLESYIRPTQHLTFTSLQVNDGIIKMVTSGETSNISQLSKIKWFEWLMCFGMKFSDDVHVGSPNMPYYAPYVDHEQTLESFSRPNCPSQAQCQWECGSQSKC